jgi:hypothetical protein
MMITKLNYILRYCLPAALIPDRFPGSFLKGLFVAGSFQFIYGHE